MVKELIKKKFTHGNFVYTYYRFLDRFHCEPKSWRELLEFHDFMETDSSVRKFVVESTKQE